MTDDSRSCENKIKLSVPVHEAWELLTDPSKAEALFPEGFRADLVSYGEVINGHVVIGRRAFTVRMKKYDIELFDDRVRIGVRVSPQTDGCAVLVAAVCASSSEKVELSIKLSDVLGRLRTETGGGVLPVFKKSEVADEGSVYAGRAKHRDTSDALHTQKKQETASGTYSRRGSESKGKKKNGGRVTALFVAAIIVAGVVFGAALALGQISLPTLGARSGGDVTLEKVESIEPGTPKGEIEKLFDTKGTMTDGCVIYESAQLLGTSEAARQVKVSYDAANKATELVYLDLDAARAAKEVRAPSGLMLSPEQTGAELAEAVGESVTLYRASASGREYHFGYTDPFASFDEEWRGSFAVKRAADGTMTSENWYSFLSYDPLLKETLDGPLAAQYDDYGDFLNDKYEFDRDLYLLSQGFSRGDLSAVLVRELGEGETHAGTRLYAVPQLEGESIKLTVGTTLEGVFRIASGVNMRLFDKDVATDASKASLLGEGMTYADVAATLGMMPTAFTVDTDSCAVCYGKYLGGESADTQFEIVVRFGRANGLAKSVSVNIDAGSAGWGFDTGE